MGAKEKIKELLGTAGVEVNGSQPWDMQVHNEKLYSRILAQGSLGLGEAYMDGWWDAEKLDEFFHKVLSIKVDKKVTPGIFLNVVKAKLMNMQDKDKSKRVAQQHYDLGNEFYMNMLDKNYMQYTCAYWKNAKTLQQAQENKLKLSCEKLKLKKGEKVLELGCGFGGFAYYAAKNYKVSVDAYNISKQQIIYGRKLNSGLPINIIEADYREAKGVFDKVASIGLCEHVGPKNYSAFMKVAHDSLKDNGLFIIHTIGRNTSGPPGDTDPWITKYIFPGGHIPSIKQLSEAAEPYFVIEDIHNFGADYDRTLMAWYSNFDKNWHKFDDKGERFYRMWKYYLLACAGSFRARSIQLWQVVLSKNGVHGGYESVR